MKIILGSIVHESSTFNPSRTNIDAFRRTQYLVGPEVIARHSNMVTEMGGVLKVLGDASVTPVPILSAVAMCAGLVVRKAYDELKGRIVDGVKKEIGQAEGVLLVLHGSMSVEGLEDPEGDLLASLRELLPASKCLVATLDHHANVTEQMVENSEFMVGYRTHPHVDQFEVGVKTATLLLDQLRNRRDLKKGFVKLPLLTPAENRNEPIVKLAEETRGIESVSGVFTGSFFVGYPWADLGIAGASTLVVTDGDQKLADAQSARLAQLMWGMRREFQFPIHPVEEAIRLGRESTARPIVLNELCDCTLGGAPGDVVSTTRYLLDHEISDSVVLGIVDPEAAKKAAKAGTGASVRLKIGGHTTKERNAPLDLECTVEFVVDNFVSGGVTHPGFETPLGRTVVVSAKGVKIVIIEHAGKIEGPEMLRSLGIDPGANKYIVSKEGLNTFLTYGSIGGKILMVDCAGLNRQFLRAGDYRKVRRPIFPLDPNMEWSAPVPERT